MKKATVIGSGISGLSIARMLKGKYDVLILEKLNKIGGLIKCDRIDGNLFHKVGGHVFNSKNKVVIDWFWQHFNRDEEFINATRNAKILMNDNLIGYPLENYIYQLPENDTRIIISELLELAKREKNGNKIYTNFEDFLIGTFGEHLYHLYFGPYNSKIWNTDISKVPLEWLDGKLPMPKIKEVIISNIIKKEESDMVHSTFYYPKRDGSQFIVNRLSQQQNIHPNYHVFDISLNDKQLSINNGDLKSDVIVYCGDVRQLYKIIKINDEQLNASLKEVKTLKSNGTSNVFCETDKTIFLGSIFLKKNLKHTG